MHDLNPLSQSMLTKDRFVSQLEYKMPHFDDFDELDEIEIPTQEKVLNILTGYDLRKIADRLGQLQDGLPLPQLFDWDEYELESEPEANISEAFTPEQKKYLTIFVQLIHQDRKSSKYFQAFQQAFDPIPHEAMSLMIADYLYKWHPDQVDAFVETQLQQHPDWLNLRMVQLKFLIMRHDFEQMSDNAQARFRYLMDNKTELHEFLPEGHVPTLMNGAHFYLAQFIWFLYIDRHFERAWYALNALFCIYEEIERFEDFDGEDETKELLIVLALTLTELMNQTDNTGSAYIDRFFDFMQSCKK